ncbi:DUF4129 domain-containing protein [Desulfosporosinus meridiei]|uniref:Protein-glutamine gamma-glutamyltransferase-like C-terminal domain-containing protein n=1 Tax=Desulfosporosinus meridiei (strain ATCC BAA-275 / DSM 13257 / KCTC 12902 / NCIMB 13706 / S10) TaxID=768704 RepID=J7IU42_DESMD|nr:DUF4129 domain-containing protein [Desulfosporosinus meridiei]AFQ45240.1 hypothetical protein Desmer_3374 [Desulfosporosinus meridiei DSM 13257]
MKPLDTFREELHKILVTQEYQVYTQESKSLFQGLFDELKNWLHQMLQNLFPHTDVAKSTSAWLSYGIATLGTVLLLVLLFLFISRFVRQGRIHLDQISMFQGQAFTAHDHLREAHRLAQEGNYHSALRNLFLGLIIYLDQNQRIVAKTWKTNWEYYVELKDRSAQQADSFYSLAIKFEEAMYGGRPITKDDYWLSHNQVDKWIHEGDSK